MPYTVTDIFEAQTAINDLDTRVRRVERVVKLLAELHLPGRRGPHAFNDARLRAAATTPDPD